MGLVLRPLLLVLPTPLLFALGAPAAPVPKHLMKNGPTYYFPTTVGSKWVYENSGEDWVYVVTKVEERKGTKVVTVEREVGEQRAPEEIMEVSATGFFRTHQSGEALGAPLEILKVPFKVGDSWTFRFEGTDGTKTIGAIETIKVPAGTFEAVRVDTDHTRGNQRHQSRWWYAPGTGLLKMNDGGNDQWVLKSFAPGTE